MFQLGEELLYRIQIGAVGGQEDQVRTGVADGLSDSLALVAAQIVEDNDIAGFQRWYQRLLNPGAEAFAVDRPVEQKGRVHTVAAQGGKEGVGPPAPVR